MGGGGSKGAWESGVLWGLYYAAKEDGNKHKYQYDVVSGVSTGSVNSGEISFFEKGKEEEML